MATYEYHCEECGHTFEHRMTLHEHEEHRQHEDAEPRCPKCGSTDVRQMPSSFQAVSPSKA